MTGRMIGLVVMVVHIIFIISRNQPRFENAIFHLGSSCNSVEIFYCIWPCQCVHAFSSVLKFLRVIIYMC